MPIAVSEKALRQLKDVLARERKPAGTGFRVAVKGGGCAGFEYQMDFETKTRDFDEEFLFDGVPFRVDGKSYFFLNGTMLDYDDSNPLQQQFVWRNPNAQSTCGCGTSFSV